MGARTPRVGRVPGSHGAFRRCTGPATPTSMQDHAIEYLSAHSSGSPNNVQTHCKLCPVQQVAARVGLKRCPPDAHGEANLNLGTSQSVLHQPSFPLLSTSALIQVMPVIGRSCRCGCLPSTARLCTARQLCVLGAAVDRVVAKWDSRDDADRCAGASRQKLLSLGFLAVPVEVPYRHLLRAGLAAYPITLTHAGLRCCRMGFLLRHSFGVDRARSVKIPDEYIANGCPGVDHLATESVLGDKPGFAEDREVFARGRRGDIEGWSCCISSSWQRGAERTPCWRRGST